MNNIRTKVENIITRLVIDRGEECLAWVDRRRCVLLRENSGKVKKRKPRREPSGKRVTQPATKRVNNERRRDEIYLAAHISWDAARLAFFFNQGAKVKTKESRKTGKDYFLFRAAAFLPMRAIIPCTYSTGNAAKRKLTLEQ